VNTFGVNFFTTKYTAPPQSSFSARGKDVTKDTKNYQLIIYT